MSMRLGRPNRLFRLRAAWWAWTALAVLGVGTARADFLYGVTNNSGLPLGNGLLLKIDPATAATTLVGNTGFQAIESVVTDGQGGLLATAYPGSGLAYVNELIHIDPTTGQGTAIGKIQSDTMTYQFIEGLAWVDGKLLASASVPDSICPDCSNHLLMIDPATGHATEIGQFGAAFQNVEEIAYLPGVGLIGADIGTLDPNTNFQTFLTTPALVRIDPTTGAATKIADLPGVPVQLVSNVNNNILSPAGPFLAGLSFAPDGTLYAATIPTQFQGVPSLLATVNLTNGQITTVGSMTASVPNLQGIDGLAYIASVPEPCAALLLGLGLACVLGGRDRRRVRTAGAG